ncbi:hypothetical protein [Pseudomonas putida]|uniref:SMODS-associating 2TM beta-strand rich effector domain-containing protein n=1 Tax=Pseudomonas putida TaxID=303 RepID=A0AAW6PN12_PSEPU|nr:hypothetical protein [Pseudomonas putida]MDF3871064.1 hypothetical protein [Pseudomonas putida]MDF3876868.1 hypothetical protein [Pseudomonas putida]
MNDIDSPDFAKVRGFLIGFSSIALLLWFYGVDLTTIKFLGLEIVPKRNASHSWGLIAIVNLYLVFRFYQRIPENTRRFDDRMNKIYDQALGWVALVIYRFELKREGRKLLSESYPDVKFEKIETQSLEYTISCHDKLAEAETRSGPEDHIPSIHEVDREYRTSVIVTGFFIGQRGPHSDFYSRYAHLKKTMPAIITWSCKAFAGVRGMCVTPWFTDNWLPLALGAFAVVVSAVRWVAINVV